MKLILKIKDVEHILEMGEAEELYNELDKIFGQKETIERVVHEYPLRWWPPTVTWRSDAGYITLNTIKD